MIHVIGRGTVGKALYAALFEIDPVLEGGVKLHSSRRLQKCEECEGGPGLRLSQVGAKKGDTIIYAAGRAGEAACVEDPVAAAYAHYATPLNLVQELRNKGSFARLVLIGTTLPRAGLYGTLKQAMADKLLTKEYLEGRMPWGGAGGALLHLRCGQVIGPEMPVNGRGVVAAWIRQAVAQQPLAVHDEQAPLDITLLADLARDLVAWLTTPVGPRYTYMDTMVISATLGLHELALACLTAAGPARYPSAVPMEIATALRAMADNARTAQQAKASR